MGSEGGLLEDFAADTAFDSGLGGAAWDWFGNFFRLGGTSGEGDG